jgi:hypothetical protein
MKDVTIVLPCDLDELEPVELAMVTEVTGSAPSGGGDDDNVVWANEP